MNPRFIKFARFSIALIAIAVLEPKVVVAQVDANVDYARDVRPLLSRHCYTCHGPDPGSRESGLRLDRADGALAVLDSGVAAIVPGSLEESELIRRLTSEDSDERMPPVTSGHTLLEQEIETLQRWISSGAKFDDHWSFRPLAPVDLPDVDDVDWSRNPIDRFVLASLEKRGIAVSDEANRSTLIRRLYFDLLGLPPAPDDLDRFLKDDRSDAYERLVDRLLASPRFGERWGRHWLDLAHYADSDGYLSDAFRPSAWLYRDWVIESFNSDMPFDQFTIEQLAGDLLPDATLSQKTATGFLRNTLRNTEAGVDLEEYRLKEVVDRVSTIGVGWLGLSLGCAECHSHKYDPISQQEFYQLFAFFNDADDIDLSVKLAEDEVHLPDEQQQAKRPKEASTKVMTVGARTAARETFVHLRGDYRNRGVAVHPGTPAVLPSLQIRSELADRLDLARWLVDPGNPLTARVVVNQFWARLFGRGLVASVDNFGVGGDLPSHPELLDWLAHELMSRGWSRKHLLRLIVCSSTYRQSASPRDDLLVKDLLNRFIARQSRFRLEAETIRDTALASAGLLENRLGGPGIRPPQPAYVSSISRNAQWDATTGGDQYRRGLYIVLRRATPYPMLLTFDAPDSTIACTGRERSNSPLQALTLLNDPVFFECAQAVGHQLATRSESSRSERLQDVFRRCLGRAAHPAELDRLQKEFKEHHSRLKANPSAAKAIVEHPAHERSELPWRTKSVDVIEEATWVLIARVLMNVDEFITRE